MGSPVRAPRTTVLALAITALASCGGDLVRLGDSPTAAGGAGSSGTAGLAGANSGGTAGAGGANGAGTAGSSGADNGGQNPGGGSAGTTSCPRGAVEADEVLWIGDSWAEYPVEHARLEELALAAGALDVGETYPSSARAAAFLSDVVAQYETRQAGMPKVKVLLMNGGTWDTIMGGSPATVATAFEQFLADVESDGTVEHIVYFLQPELPSIPGVAALRPLVRSACDASAVPCHFLDLQPVWAGHPEYTDVSGIQASDAGATAIADEIWKIMQENCIAQ